MAAEDYIPFDWSGNDFDDETGVVCRRCGKEQLEWVDCGTAGWKLYEGMKLHRCQNSAKADEFEDVSR